MTHKVGTFQEGTEFKDNSKQRSQIGNMSWNVHARWTQKSQKRDHKSFSMSADEYLS